MNQWFIDLIQLFINRKLIKHKDVNQEGFIDTDLIISSAYILILSLPAHYYNSHVAIMCRESHT